MVHTIKKKTYITYFIEVEVGTTFFRQANGVVDLVFFVGDSISYLTSTYLLLVLNYHVVYRVNILLRRTLSLCLLSIDLARWATSVQDRKM